MKPLFSLIIKFRIYESYSKSGGINIFSITSLENNDTYAPPTPPPLQFEMEFLYFLIFQEMKLCSFNILIKFPIFSQKKAFLTFPKTEPFTFQPSSKKTLKKFYI